MAQSVSDVTLWLKGGNLKGGELKADCYTLRSIQSPRHAIFADVSFGGGEVAGYPPNRCTFGQFGAPNFNLTWRVSGVRFDGSHLHLACTNTPIQPATRHLRYKIVNKNNNLT